MTEPREAEHRTTIRRRALLATAFHAAVLVLAATASASRDAATWFGVRGPYCPTGYLLGEHVCPGCGLTRGTALAVQGHWAEALATNPAGFVIVALCLLGIVLHLDVWRRARVLDTHRTLRKIGRWSLLIGVLLAWGFRILTN